MSIKARYKSFTSQESSQAPVVVREAAPADRASLRRLAERDSAPLPAEPLVVAEVGGEIRAAVSVSDRRAIADPFHRTVEHAALAEMRAAQLRRAREGRSRVVARSPRATAQTA